MHFLGGTVVTITTLRSAHENTKSTNMNREIYSSTVMTFIENIKFNLKNFDRKNLRLCFKLQLEEKFSSFHQRKSSESEVKARFNLFTGKST